MRTYVLVAFWIQAIGGLIALVSLASSDDNRWNTFFRVLEATFFAIWAACLLWR